jgi:ornithine carbamoyltransferase
MMINVATPADYAPQPQVVSLAQGDAAQSGGRVRVMTDPVEAVTDAQVLVTDVWASMGQEDEQNKRGAVFPP